MEASSEVSGFQVIVTLAILLAGLPYLSWLIAKVTRYRLQLSSVLSYVVGVVGGVLTAFIAVGISSIGNLSSLFACLLLAAFVGVLHRKVRSAPIQEHQPVLSGRDKELFAKTFGMHSSAATPNTPTTAEIEAIRARSIAGMQAATAARQRDMALRNESPSPAIYASGSALPAVTLPETVRFRYLDRDGKFSVRTVDVTQGKTDGSSGYLEGRCHLRGDTRSFRIDRIVSDLTIIDTGELVAPAVWFAAIQHKGWATFDIPTHRAAARKWQTAVYFVGFRESRRYELERLADAAGWQVRHSFSDTLDVLVAGTLAGSNQMDKADEFDVEVISEEEFRDRVFI